METCWLATRSFLFFLLIRFPAKIIVLLIKCLSCRKVNVIPAPDKATHRDLALCSGALKPADNTLEKGFLKQIRDREWKKRGEKEMGELGGR